MEKEKSPKLFTAYKTRETYLNQIRLLKQSTNEKLIIGRDGGLFMCSQEQINFVNLLLRADYASAVMFDKNETPIMIENLKQFEIDMLEQYMSVMNEMFVDYNEIYKEIYKMKDILNDMYSGNSTQE